MKKIILLIAVISISASSTLTTIWRPIYVAVSNQKVIIRVYNTSQFAVKIGIKTATFYDGAQMISGDTIYPSIRQLEIPISQGDTIWGICDRNNVILDTIYGINVVATGVK